MPDPLITGVAAYLAVQSFEALVRPSLNLVGDEAKQFLERRLRRISSSAEHKLGSKLAEDGAVNARVFKKIIDDGCLCNDGLSADYYGGFLASSRTKDGMDDANVPFVSMVNRMSSDQIHGHWILYALLFNKMQGRHVNVYTSDHRKEVALYIPWRNFMYLFDTLRTDYIEDADPKFRFSNQGKCHFVTVSDDLRSSSESFDIRRLDLVFWGLLSEDLVDHMYWGLTGWDLARQMERDFPEDPLKIGPKKLDAEQIAKGGMFTNETSMAQGGVVFQPSILGMDLFLRAQGLPPKGWISFDSLTYDFRPEQFAEEILKNVRLVGSAPPSG